MKLLAVRGNPLIGLYAKVSDNFAVVGISDENLQSSLKEILGVEVLTTTIAGSELVGAMLVINSRGVVVSSSITSKELERLRRKVEVKVVDTPMTCMGNNFCVNDKGGISHPDMDSKIVEEVSDFLDVEIAHGTLGGIKTVGMAGVITNKGGIVHPNATEWELKKVAKLMGVEALKGTANFGNDMVGSSILANSKGYLVGRDTTGLELGIIDEALFP
ncbi:MAG: translation initiation factor 6 [Archaeoglobaceae archaeon]|nr:translation initiation factor 6 [Archaeoglobaceae archaeon]MDK2876147.1 translation initiation factor 6 [Archaeoglobaceae archaeon]